MSESESRWPIAWIRAGLDLAVLGSLVGGPLHGYAVAQALHQRGFGLLKGGSLYPVLGRLESGGLIEPTWVEGSGGPGRREYAITEAGRQQLRAGLASWRQLADTLDGLATELGEEQ